MVGFKSITHQGWLTARSTKATSFAQSEAHNKYPKNSSSWRDFNLGWSRFVNGDDWREPKSAAPQYALRPTIRGAGN